MSHPGPAQHVQPAELKNGLHVGEGLPTGAAGFINVNGRLFAPLQGLAANDVTQGGYRFLDLTDGGHTYHPGVDLNSGGSCNADAGLPVVAPLAAIIRKLLPWDGWSSGEGNHLWLEVASADAPGPTWIHFDHLAAFAVVEGQRVGAGELIGYAGASGNWDCAHLHTEFLPAPPPDGWWTWPYGWTVAQVEEAYYRPSAWWNAASAKVQGATEEAIVAILSGAQSAALQAAVWGRYWNAAAADHAIESSWREEWRRGVWRGAPITDEQLIPQDDAEGKPAGSFRLFEAGLAAWLPGSPVSWNG